MARRPTGETRRKVFAFVRRRILEGRSPTVREVQKAMGFSAVQTARQHIEVLIEQGLLAKEAGLARSLRLPSFRGRKNLSGNHISFIPLLGRVQAGNLTLALEEAGGYLAVQSQMAQMTQTPRSSQAYKDELFALTVRGTSMNGAGILPDDIVVVRRQADADSGDIVVAIVGEEATVKTLRKRRNRIELHPANPDFEILKPSVDDIKILGKVIEVRRHLEGLLIYEEPGG